MNELEKQLLQNECGLEEPILILHTRTWVDTGRWWRPTRAWLCVMEHDLVLLAVSRRRYIERVPLAQCSDTHYCHATGELVISPVEGLVISRFRMSPREALTILRTMGLAVS